MYSKIITNWSKDKLWCSSRNSQRSPPNNSNQILSTPISFDKQNETFMNPSQADDIACVMKFKCEKCDFETSSGL